MLKITAEEIHFIIYQYLHESGFEHSSFVFAQEANMHENRFNEYRIPSGMLIVFLEKALTLIHMETHLDDNEEIKECKQPYSLLSPHTCDITVEQSRAGLTDTSLRTALLDDQGSNAIALNNTTSMQNNPQVEHQANSQTERPQIDMLHHQHQMMMQAAAHQAYEAQAAGYMGGHFHQRGPGLVPPSMTAPGLPHSYDQSIAQMQYNQGQQQPQQLQGLNTNPNVQSMSQQLPSEPMPAPNMGALSLSTLNQGPKPSGGVPLSQDQIFNLPAETLENNPSKGIQFLKDSAEEMNQGDIYFAQFNPQKRLLVSAGNHYIASMWDLTNAEPSQDPKQIPHVKGPQVSDRSSTDVSSIHWNKTGNRLVTSSSDQVARLWHINEQNEINIESIRNFDMMLMNSKFNRVQSNLIATGGHSGTVFIWDADSCKDKCRLNHSGLDPALEGIEIEWQNSQNIAVAGRSKNIYLWDIEKPNEPLQVWSRHEQEINQIQWDPTEQLLASCSADNYACVWSPATSGPVQTLNKFRASVNTLRWSNKDLTSGGDPLLATGSQDGTIAMWHVNTGTLLNKLVAHEKDGVQCLAFSPDNKLIASGGVDSLVLWSLKDNQQMVRNFQKPPSASPTQVSEVNWSHDGTLLAAAIHDYVAIFDIRKLSQPLVGANKV